MTSIEWVGWGATMLGTVVSIVGLCITWSAYTKIKQVKSIVRHKTLISVVIANIEELMRINEIKSLDDADKRRIEAALNSIEALLSPKSHTQKFEKGQILSIKKELSDPKPDMKNIKSALKTLKETLPNLEDS